MLANPPPPGQIGILTNQQQQPFCQLSRQQVLFKLAGEAICSDATRFEILHFVLNGGGPKWGFRIRLLNDDRVIVSRVNSRGPADKSGLKVNDEILTVNNVTLDNKPRSLLLNNNVDFDGQPSSSSYRSEATKDVEGVGEQQATVSSLFQRQSHPVELSKLDFTYQLIKHSSLSNKLILTIKRYLNPAYARASVAASSFNYDSQPTNMNIHPTDNGNKKYNSGGMHYAYKCCECYCNNDNEGKSIPHFILLPFR